MACKPHPMQHRNEVKGLPDQSREGGLSRVEMLGLDRWLSDTEPGLQTYSYIKSTPPLADKADGGVFAMRRVCFHKIFTFNLQFIVDFESKIL